MVDSSQRLLFVFPRTSLCSKLFMVTFGHETIRVNSLIIVALPSRPCYINNFNVGTAVSFSRRACEYRRLACLWVYKHKLDATCRLASVALTSAFIVAVLTGSYFLCV